MDRTTKVLSSICALLAVTVATQIYMLAEVEHTIDIVRFKIVGIEKADKSQITVKYNHNRKPLYTVHRVTPDANGVIELHNVPQGGYMIRIPTERCKPKPPTIAEMPGYREGAYWGGFTLADDRRWIKPESATMTIDLNACKQEFVFTRKDTWKWGF